MQDRKVFIKPVHQFKVDKEGNRYDERTVYSVTTTCDTEQLAKSVAGSIVQAISDPAGQSVQVVNSC
jgi:hypothetical protein